MRGSIRPARTRALNSATPTSMSPGSADMSWRSRGICAAAAAPAPAGPARSPRRPAHAPRRGPRSCTPGARARETRCIQSTRRLRPSGLGSDSTTTAPAPSDRVQRRKLVSGVSGVLRRAAGQRAADQLGADGDRHPMLPEPDRGHRGPQRGHSGGTYAAGRQQFPSGRRRGARAPSRRSRARARRPASSRSRASLPPAPGGPGRPGPAAPRRRPAPRWASWSCRCRPRRNAGS